MFFRGASFWAFGPRCCFLVLCCPLVVAPCPPVGSCSAGLVQPKQTLGFCRSLALSQLKRVRPRHLFEALVGTHGSFSRFAPPPRHSTSPHPMQMNEFWDMTGQTDQQNVLSGSGLFVYFLVLSCLLSVGCWWCCLCSACCGRWMGGGSLFCVCWCQL